MTLVSEFSSDLRLTSYGHFSILAPSDIDTKFWKTIPFHFWCCISAPSGPLTPFQVHNHALHALQCMSMYGLYLTSITTLRYFVLNNMTSRAAKWTSHSYRACKVPKVHSKFIHNTSKLIYIQPLSCLKYHQPAVSRICC
jgi:hypothetical protein